MATIQPTIPGDLEPGTWGVLWSGVSTGDTIHPAKVPFAWMNLGSVQIAGTFGGATVTLQVSNDGTNYATLDDVSGVDVSAASALIAEVSNSALYWKPSITGGSSDSVTIKIVGRGGTGRV